MPLLFLSLFLSPHPVAPHAKERKILSLLPFASAPAAFPAQFSRFRVARFRVPLLRSPLLSGGKINFPRKEKHWQPGKLPWTPCRRVRFPPYPCAPAFHRTSSQTHSSRKAKHSLSHCHLPEKSPLLSKSKTSSL